jgi:hypothetical protein
LERIDLCPVKQIIRTLARMEPAEMPLARYFLFVGGALLALLFIVDACLPKLPAVESASAVASDSVSDLSVIRIHSDRKWPERVEFDTSQPTIVPSPLRTAEAAAPTAVAEVATPVPPRDAFAQLQTPKKPEPKLAHKRRTVARNRVNPSTMLVAQQPRLGFFTNTGWW